MNLVWIACHFPTPYPYKLCSASMSLCSECMHLLSGQVILLLVEGLEMLSFAVSTKRDEENLEISYKKIDR